MKNLPHYIYVDTTVVGAAKQIATFFHRGIFSTDKVVVLIKKNRLFKIKNIMAVFRQHNIRYRLVINKDIDTLEKGIVFYPFNTQPSSCRVVANRHLKHIFITHGESNKSTSVKPMTRIYDYIVTAGQAGIDRYLTHHIFTPYDIEQGRLITMGDTFIGSTGLSADGKKCIFYAPTWEGSIDQENYSSLTHWQAIARRLIQHANQQHINTIVIKPHPNTGHRLRIYRQHIFNLAKNIKENGFDVWFYQSNMVMPFWQKWKYQQHHIQLSGCLKDFQAALAICDISAMETQLLNENIPYEIYCDDSFVKNTIEHKEDYQLVFNDNNIKLFTLKDFKQHQKYVLDSQVKNIAMQKRIDFLLSFVKD